ncbi:MAG TPA: F0F1 ATP synthase subunit A [Bacteroidia bacterium]|jgi:F-type H+-transporting ATPase subunit a
MSKRAKHIFKFSTILLVLVTGIITARVAFAQDGDSLSKTTASTDPKSDKKDETKKFNAGELIIGHITDSHEWHLWGSEEHPVAIPLPVIIYSDKGLDIFMSNKFEEGVVEGKYRYTLVKNDIKVVDENGAIDETASAKLWDLSITKNVASIIFTMALLAWIFISAAKAYARRPGTAPKGLQSAVEPLIIFVRDDIAKSSIGEKHYRKYLPFLLTVFFFIWTTNLLGLIPIAPGGANVTGNIAVALTLAAIVFLITTFSAKSNYWRHVFAMPGVPVGVLVLLTPIEIFGVFLRPFVLMIRLFANILAGHIIALSFFSLIFIFAEMNTGLGYGVSVLSIAFTVFMGMLELLVAFLQAYVFTLLAAMYFGSAVEEHHHDDYH